MIHFKDYTHASIYEILNLHNPDMTEEMIWEKFCAYYEPSEECALPFYIPTDEEICDPDWGFEDWQIEIINRIIDAGIEQAQLIYLDISE